MKVTGIILAGGKSSRMGTDKATLEYKGKMLFDWSLQTIKPLCNQIVVSSNSPKLNNYGYKVIADIYTNAGPMAGIAACLEQSDNEIAIVIACDTPFIDTKVYETLLQHINSFDVVMACNETNYAQPLIACYKKSVLPFLNSQLQAGNYSLKSLLNIDKCKLQKFNSNQLSVNLNSPIDLM